jgi:hypothetical protein
MDFTSLVALERSLAFNLSGQHPSLDLLAT